MEAAPKKAEPLIEMVTIRETDWNPYPDIVRVPMTDGTVQNYQIVVPQPHPAFQQVIHLLDKLPVYGGYKAPEIKKRRRL